MEKMGIRIKESYQTYIFEFIDEILIVCPECGQSVVVVGRGFTFARSNVTPVKLICTHCGHNKFLIEKPTSVLYSTSEKQIVGRVFLVGAPVDPFFHLPLFLIAPCCGRTLWAYNHRHLTFLESHVEDTLRERNHQPMANSSLGSSLPKWMTAKGNREEVIKCIAKMRVKERYIGQNKSR